MRTGDGYLHQHALDVTITATMIASRLKYPVADIQELALGSFLMDLGMIIIPQAALSKVGPPSAKIRLLMKEHPAVGFTILRANKGVPINAAHVAYQHHERLDGGGYPRGLKSPDVFPRRPFPTKAATSTVTPRWWRWRTNTFPPSLRARARSNP